METQLIEREISLLKGQVDLSLAMKYILAPRAKGKAIITFAVQNRHYTYMTKTNKDHNIFFVYGLCGPDNTSHYKYFGYIRIINNKPEFYFGTAKSAIQENSDIVIAFKNIWKIINNVNYLSTENTLTQDYLHTKKFNTENEAINYATLNNLIDYLTVNIIINNNSYVIIQKKIKHNYLTMWHSSNCCRCGRVLTVETSIMAGMGAMCSRLIMMGK